MKRGVIVPTGDVVYFVRQGDRGPVKIGTTKHLQERLRALATGNSFKLVLLAVERGGRRREAELHRRFSSCRGRGEWFWPKQELVDYIREIGGSIDGVFVRAHRPYSDEWGGLDPRSIEPCEPQPPEVFQRGVAAVLEALGANNNNQGEPVFIPRRRSE